MGDKVFTRQQSPSVQKVHPRGNQPAYKVIRHPCNPRKRAVRFSDGTYLAPSGKVKSAGEARMFKNDYVAGKSADRFLAKQ